MYSNFSKILLVSVQLLAIMLLQAPIFLPVLAKVFSSHSRGSVCFHDHRLCGCSPDRIANHTCCCFRSAKAARLVAASGEHENHDFSCHHHGKRATTRHFLTMMPCGAASPLFESSVQDYLFVHYAGEMSLPVPSDIPIFEYPGDPLQGHFDPPDPPPKLLFSV